MKMTADRENNEGFFSELVRFAITALVIVLPIRIFIAQPFIVSGASMDPTFASGEYLIVDELSYRFEMPDRGDVVIFRFPEDKSKFFIKRVIGLPGETVRIVDGEVFIINRENTGGFRLEESYVEHMSRETLTYLLGENEYFVMGDNRKASSDSRTWGALPKSLIKGRPFIRLLPVNELELFPGEIEKNVSSS